MNGTIIISEDTEYKIIDESYEDDYGCLVSNYVVYSRLNKKKKEKWKRYSPDSQRALSYHSALKYIPRKLKKCKECGHLNYEPFKFKD